MIDEIVFSLSTIPVKKERKQMRDLLAKTYSDHYVKENDIDIDKLEL